MHSLPQTNRCFSKTPVRRRIYASSCYPAFFQGHQRNGSKEYYSMMRKRKIWSEGRFSVLKREHLLSMIRKRGILCATEECLLAAMAINLNRMKMPFHLLFSSVFDLVFACVFREIITVSTGPSIDTNSYIS